MEEAGRRRRRMNTVPGDDGEGRTSLIARNVRINGRRTSMRLEPEFWSALAAVAKLEGSSVAQVCTSAAQHCPGTATSAVRVYVLRKMMQSAGV